MDAFRKASKIVRVSRPIFWTGLPIGFLGGFQVAGASFTPLAMLQLVLLFFPFTVFLYGINDYYDRNSDRKNDRKGGLEGESLPDEDLEFVRKAAWLSALLLVASSIVTFNFTNIIGMAILVFFSHQYSAPPLRLKVRAPLDSLSNGLIYLLGPAIMGYSFGGTIFQLPSEALWFSVAVMGAHSFSTIMDYSADKGAGDSTFAVRFGKNNAAFVALLSMLAVYVLGGIQFFLARYYFVLGILLMTLQALKPGDKKLAHRIFWLMFVVGLGFVAATFFVLNTPYSF